VVVNLDEQTVFFLGYVVPIAGHIDRASGRMAVTTVTLDPTKPNDPEIAALRYDAICASNGA
jgi:hypothetical protein